MADKINWGIIGLGRIARKFAENLQLLPSARLAAVASRDIDKAIGFASEYGAAKAYGSYKELLEDKAIEVVYIATPHTFHLEHSLMALHSGKHVLCEKPLGINARQVAELQKAASQTRLFMMEALWSRFNPSIREILQRVKSGQLGKPAYLRADFAFPALDRDPSGRLLNPELGGGSLLDIGIYPVFLAYLFLGVPDEIKTVTHFGPTGIEQQIGMVFKYPQAVALLYSGLSSRSGLSAEISGTLGSIYLHPPWYKTDGYELQIGEERSQVSLPAQDNGFLYEIEEVHHCLQNRQRESNLWSLEDSHNLLGILDRVREASGIAFPGESAG
ncbi:Gfo/Idh/MocA family protein [Robiginitalea sp. IMCC43444]|uniref:Gfo/Idh/MocA family protein n=1 Tax=Robiginitalea sp. IMCC43444 TaxID=3459121 RepID=UPI004043733D